VTAADRAERTRAADARCARAYADHANRDQGGPDTGVALVAVGGYGRGELAPYSDLDVVLVHRDDVDPGKLAETVWYPLWDSGVRLDHSVRSMGEMAGQAAADLKVALGLLDVRHLAGDPHLTLRLRTAVLAQWRRDARDRLPELRAMCRARHEASGELAHAAVPDLKGAEGGLRDATVMAALVATWLVDVPPDLERARQQLLDVRDELHTVAGRATDRVPPEAWAELAERLGWADATAAQRRVRELGRRVTHLSRLAWRRVDAVLARPTRGGAARRPDLQPIAPGLALSSGEVVLDRRARPGADPLLLLRAAAEAAERDAVLAPATAARLARDGAPLPNPWPAAARHLLVRLLASGRGLLGVWETLEETGAVDRILPEWERIRLLPHASTIHRFTVDRHLVETCVEASALIRRVARPDVLVVAALLHDIGKGDLVEHSVAGEPIAHEVATRIGFDAGSARLVASLVRHHLVLAEVATTRDPDDPVTAAQVADTVTSAEELALLAALTEADARATAAKAWSTWRASLVSTLVRRTGWVLEARAAGVAVRAVPEPALPVPDEVLRDPDRVAFTVEPTADGVSLTAIARDRVGLLADLAAVLALARVPVRGARAWEQDGLGFTVWDLAETQLDPAVLRQRYDAVRAGRVDPAARLARGEGELPSSVAVRPEASDRSTVLEVRTGDRPGVVHLVCAALAEIGVSVRSAHVDTLGPQAVDVFYLQEEAAGALAEERAATAAHVVRSALDRSSVQRGLDVDAVPSVPAG
jgi:[protein-PII] uridylyltransferase